MKHVYRLVRQARPDAWLAAVIVACVFAGGSERRAASSAKPSKASDVVHASVYGTAPEADGSQRVHLVLNIAADWHVYAHPAGADLLANAQTVVTFKVGNTDAEAAIDYPAGEQVSDDLGTYKVYRGRVTIPATVKHVDPSQPLTAFIEVQACNEKKRQCLPPGKVIVSIP